MDTQPEKKKSLSRSLYLALAIIIAGVLLYFAIRGVSWQEIVQTLRQADPRYLVVIFFVFSLSVFTRGLRWGVLISAQKRVSALTMFWATMVGYLGNTFLPARAGEVIRSVLLGRKEGISKSYVFATAITERIFDVVLLVLIGVFVVPSIGSLPDWLPGAMRLMGIIGGAAVVVLLLAPRLRGLITRIVGAIPLPAKWHAKLDAFLEEFLQGAEAFIHPGRAAGFLGLSALVWFLDATGAVLMSMALNVNLTYPQALLLLVGMGLSSAIPSTPGYVGIYQFVAVTLLPLYGISRSRALTFILAEQAAMVFVITLWGLIGLWRLNSGKLTVATQPDDPLV